MITQGEMSIRKHRKDQSLERGGWGGEAGIRVSASHCLKDREIDLNENSGVSQHDPAQQDGRNIKQLCLDQGLGQIGFLLPFLF